MEVIENNASSLRAFRIRHRPSTFGYIHSLAMFSREDGDTWVIARAVI
jgi:hypothetical protein